ncbi:alkaline phosphatase D family protein [Pseudohaliea rubra]|uniref:Secreted alkaline phosphatase n=1 Tax=Pseudohaliea rubra DSM 19751 TaxID=1265313 RepID=A0A095XXB6_9GAMM|nr:alkaline phosphatase D family protein [Pseudohaliea rubra]KGE04356.1 secreted alkaline phosphatase [Pseudohaliea rubra DSM 19751]
MGDMRADSAIIWSRCDRPARMEVRVSTRPDLKELLGRYSVDVLDASDYTGQVLVAGLPAGSEIHYQVSFLDLADYRTRSATLTGRFRTPPAAHRPLRFLWSGDTVGQGFGINPDLGGMQIYETMRRLRPDFFIHCGDMVYADGPLEEWKQLPDGRQWRNLTSEAKAKVAETLDEFRGQYRYNLLDSKLRRFNSEVPMYAQWDDHEVTNNWFWERRLNDDPRYREHSVALLAARAMRAFRDYVPVRQHPLDAGRLYDSFRYGPQLEVFRIDLRSYRGPNSDAQPRELSPELRILGSRQFAWLERALRESTATWKVIASDMPLGLVAHHDWKTERGAEAVALRDGTPAGREVEIALLLKSLRDHEVRNVLWLTADVHYTAAHYYDPAQAQFRDFLPFWEFVSGPLNAGTFGPNRLDNTFGPQLVYQKVPPAGAQPLSPLDGMQFFGQVDIDPESEVLTVRLKDLAGETLYTQELTPAG